MMKLITKLYYWYLFNYRSVHHCISLFMLSSVLYFIWGKEIFHNIFICLMCLVLNYYGTKWSLRKSGLDKTIKDEIKRLEKNNDDFTK